VAAGDVLVTEYETVAALTTADLRDAIIDLCWKATPYGGGASVGAYLLPAGTVHRLIGAAQGAGIPAAFRTLDPS
jgi:hypothetical protein